MLNYKIHAFHITFQVKLYREYEKEHKPVNQLTEEDQFLLHLSKIDRLATKLQLMSFIANYTDNIHAVTPVSNKLLILEQLGHFV